MYHDGTCVGWEVACRNFNYRHAIEFANKAAAQELVIVARAKNSCRDLFLDSIVESWVYPKDASSDWSFCFIERSAHLKDIAVSIVSCWCIILRSSGSTDASLQETVSINHRDDLLFHLSTHDFASFLSKRALLVVTIVNRNLERLVVVDCVSGDNIFEFVVATKAVASVGAIIVGWSNSCYCVNFNSLSASEVIFFVDVAIGI